MGFSAEEVIQRLKQIAKVELISDAFDKLGIENKIIPSNVSQIEPRYNYSQSLCGRAYTVLFSDIYDEREGIGYETRFYLDNVPQNVIVVIHNEVGTQYST